ncbi:MAG: hypothetical protein ABWK53_01000 [Anaerolineales bacterium]
MALQGKGFFTYLLRETEGGDPAAIVDLAKSAGLSHVLVKIADGPVEFGVDSTSGDYTAPVVAALRSAGIAVWGWHYVYGDNPSGEAAVAIRRVQALQLDGYVVDAEDEYKRPGKAFAARRFMSEVRAALTLPIALSSYRFPNYHPELPWSTFLEFCDYNMPQVYWEQAHNAGWQLRESKRQCDALPNAKPYLATAPAYGVGDWAPTPEDLLDFMETARALQISAVNFFQWGYCRKHLPNLWRTIAEYAWPAPVQVASVQPVGAPAEGAAPVPSSGGAPGGSQTLIAAPDAFTAKYFEALNTRRAATMMSLYQPNAIHVRGERVTRTFSNIRNDYSTFFASAPVGTFSPKSVEVNGDIRYLTWKLGSRTGTSIVVLKEGKIILDYFNLI